MDVQKLKNTEEEIINEVARISNGEVTEIAKKMHALELRKISIKTKNSIKVE